MSFKIFRRNCCGLDVHKTWIYACIGITDANGRTDYKQARFSSFSKGLRELCDWLAKYHCSEVCMESTGKYWIPVFNILEKADNSVVLAHPKYTKPQKGNKTDRKDAKWICDLFMCDMIKPSFIPPSDIRHLRDLVRYRFKLPNMPGGMPSLRRSCLPAQTIHESSQFIVSSFSLLCYTFLRTTVHYRARRGEWRKTILSRKLICAVILFKHKQLRLRVRTLII